MNIEDYTRVRVLRKYDAAVLDLHSRMVRYLEGRLSGQWSQLELAVATTEVQRARQRAEELQELARLVMRERAFVVEIEQTHTYYLVLHRVVELIADIEGPPLASSRAVRWADFESDAELSLLIRGLARWRGRARACDVRLEQIDALKATGAVADEVTIEDQRVRVLAKIEDACERLTSRILWKGV